MDRPARLEIFRLVARAAAGPRHGEERVLGLAKDRGVPQHRPDLLEVLAHVRGQVEVAARDENARDVRQRRRRKEAALAVSFLRPWVGAVDVHAADRAIGQERLQDMARVGAKQADVPETPALRPILGHAQVLERPLDPEKIDLGARRGLLQDESPLAGADLQLDRTDVPEQGGKVERTADAPGEDLQGGRFR